MSVAARARWTQFEPSSELTDLRVGHLDPLLIPVPELRAAMARATRRGTNGRALVYGANQGPSGLREHLVCRLASESGGFGSGDDVFITAGISHALDLIAADAQLVGEAILVEAPTYDLAVALFRHHGVAVYSFPFGGSGADVERAAYAAKKQGYDVRYVYSAPRFHNPTGVSLSPEQRGSLLAAAAEIGCVVVEDDAYREISFDDESRRTLIADAPDRCIYLGSASKAVAPGLRVGWLVANSELVQRIYSSPLFESGGGIAHLGACVLQEFLESEDCDRHLMQLRTSLQARRDALLAGLSSHGHSVDAPAGGFFAWVELPERARVAPIITRLKEARVLVADGASFGSDSPALRLAFSAYSETRLEHAGTMVAECLARYEG